MKLYTEEQVNFAMRYTTITKESYKEILKQLIPIELPSDEEIEKVVEQEYKRHNEFLYGCSDELKLAYKAGVWDGVKWIKEQILNQNK